MTIFLMYLACLIFFAAVWKISGMILDYVESHRVERRPGYISISPRPPKRRKESK